MDMKLEVVVVPAGQMRGEGEAGGAGTAMTTT
jgi:hypothetical protein